MSSTKSIYITYSETGAKENARVEKWIKIFIENLQITISRTLSVHPGYLIKGKDFSENDYETYINRADVYILIFDEAFQNDIAYQKEMESICASLNLTPSETNLESAGKVFKVNINKVDDNFEPPAIKDIIPYNFYDFNLFNRKVLTYQFDNERAELAWSKILDLVYALRDVFNNEKADRKDKKHVYLGDTSIDQIANRDEIARELQHFGFRILPITVLPEESDKFKETVMVNLEQSQLIVQIHGAQYGSLIGQGRYSIPDFQNQVIREYIKNNPDKNFYRIIWIPLGLRITDQRQKLFIQKVKRDEVSIKTEIVETPIEIFKTILQDRITTLPENKSKTKIKHTIYLIHEESKIAEVKPFVKIIQDEGFKVYTPKFDIQEQIYKEHLNNIKHAENILIYEGDKNLFWLKSKIRDLIKAPGIGRNKPLDKISIITDRLIESKDLDFIAKKLEFIKTDKDSFKKYLINLKNNHDN